jgi:hypothetical protein
MPRSSDVPDPSEAQDVPMMINEGIATVLVEERSRDLRSAARWRWTRRRNHHSTSQPTAARP